MEASLPHGPRVFLSILKTWEGEEALLEGEKNYSSFPIATTVPTVYIQFSEVNFQ